MNRHVWLRPNRRALGIAAVPPALALLPAVYLICLSGVLAQTLGWILIGVAGGLLAATLLAAWQPRLAVSGEQLLVYLRAGGPIAVPLDVVECFFLGQGPAMLIEDDSQTGEGVVTANVIVRLAESAEEWKQLSVLKHLGHWCDGYITIRGAWCEPISNELVGGLNKKLAAAHRAQRQRQEAGL